MSTSHAPTGLEPGSFRDPESRVFYAGDDVFRALSADGLSDFEELEATGLLDGERVVRTERADGTAAAEGLLVHEPAAVLRHERIPFVSYPYEWTFSMLKDAALLQLDLLLAALEHDMVLKDSTPYNVQFKGARPVFVDVALRAHPRGRAVGGYRQFCMLYLYPLLLQSAKGVPFQPWLRGAIDGITPEQMRGLMSFRDRFRKGVFTNVFLHAKLEERYADRPAQVKQEVKRVFKKELFVANVRKMRKLVGGSSGARPRASGPPTASATATRTTTPPQGRVRPRGGEEPRLEARLGHRLQQRPLLADRRRGREDGDRRRRRPGPGRAALPRPARGGQRADPPLTMNLADPSPGLGWRGLERKVDAGARQAGPRARARARAPRGHQRQRAGEGVRRLAGLAPVARW